MPQAGIAHPFGAVRLGRRLIHWADLKKSLSLEISRVSNFQSFFIESCVCPWPYRRQLYFQKNCPSQTSLSHRQTTGIGILRSGGIIFRGRAFSIIAGVGSRKVRDSYLWVLSIDMNLTSYPLIPLFYGMLILGLFPDSSRAKDSGPKFQQDFDESLAIAKESDQPLIVIFSASWCAPCQQMKRAVYPGEEVRPYRESFVWAYLDADAEENRSLMTRFGVRGIPYIAFLRPDGSVIDQLMGVVPPAEFSEALDRILKEKTRSREGSE